MMSLADESGGHLSYARVIAAPFLSKSAADRGLTKADLEKFQVSVADYLRSPTTRECLNDDMKNLTDIVMSTETCFADIYHQMTRIDHKKLLLDQEGHFIDFAPKWRVLHDVGSFDIDILATNFIFNCIGIYLPHDGVAADCH